jgi:putative ABC transport system permease protein
MKVNNLAHLALLSLRLLVAEIRAGKMTVIILALVLAVGSATIISVFSQRLDANMLNKSSDLLGADLRILSSEVISKDWYQQAHNLGLKTATTLEFPSVVLLNEEMALAAVKAVDDNYPLKGLLSTKQQASLQQGPAKGEVWLEPRLLALLNAKLGDVIEVGAIKLEIAAIIINESDRAGNFYSLSPRLMMNLQNVAAAKLVQPGSRVSWRMLVAGDDLALQTLQQEIDPLLASHQRFESLTDNNQALAASLAKARSYLSLAAMLAIILAGIAIAMAAQDYARHHFDSSALLRTLGASRRRVTNLYLYQLVYLAFFSSVLGLALGYIGQEVFARLLASAFNRGGGDVDLPSAGISAWLVASLTAPVTLMGFALPPLLRLGRVSPLRVLRRELEPMAWNSWAIYGLGLVMMVLLSYWFGQNFNMSLIIIIGGFFTSLVLLFILQFLLFVANKLILKASLPMSLRFAWQQINRDRFRTSIQILAFALTLMVMLIIAIVRNDLLQNWQQNLPQDSANFFAMNIQGYQVKDYQQDLEQAGFSISTAFPMVAGRLIAINETLVKEHDLYGQDPAVQRDLVLSGGKELPLGNTIVEGQWFSQHSSAEVSIALSLAKRLQLALGDQLTFDVAGQSINARISSFRKVDWGSMKSNFYVLFSRDIVQKLPLNYLTSFYVPEDKAYQLTAIIRTYPGITLLDMSQVLIQVQDLLRQVTLAVGYLLVLILLAGILILVATLHSSLDDRLQQGAVLRTLGANRQQLQVMQWIEFLLLGGLAGLIAIAGAEVICWLLYQRLFQLQYSWHLSYWLWLPMLAAIVISALAQRNLVAVINQPPLAILRKL